MNRDISKAKKETLVLVCILLVCIFITLALLIILINTSKAPVSQTNEPQLIEIDNIEAFSLSDAQKLLDGAQITYEIIPTDSRIPNRVERIEYVGQKNENGKLNVEVGTTVKIYSNAVEQDKIIYLTFDDGPTRYNTLPILDTLDSYGIKATFYVLGNRVGEYSQQTKATIERGHLIGCHSFSHVYSTIYSSPKAFLDEVDQYENALKSVLGEDEYAKIQKFLRFPGGSIGLEKEYIDGVRNKGYKIHDWTAETKDRNGCSTTEEFIENLFIELDLATKTNKPLIVLMHDMETTKNSLPEILDRLVAEGYYFDTIDNCPEYTFAEN